MIGARRNAVSIVAHALQQAGIINCSRGHIDITDAEGLRESSASVTTPGALRPAAECVGPEIP
jgi:hypothetical protein